MIPLDVYTPAVSLSLGSGDTAMFVVAALIVLVCPVPFLGGGGRR